MLKQNISANYGKNFWSGKIGYVGDLTFSDEGISFQGNSRTFMMKIVPISLEIKREEVKEVQFTKNSVEIKSSKGNYHFILNFNYNASGISNTRGGTFAPGAWSDILNVKLSSDLENNIKTIHSHLVSEPGWSNLVVKELKGTSLTAWYLASIFMFRILPILLALGIIIRGVLKIRSL